jgi:hypothetical protein
MILGCGSLKGTGFSPYVIEQKYFRLYSRRKNSTNAAVLKGHGFIRANKLHQISQGFNP